MSVHDANPTDEEIVLANGRKDANVASIEEFSGVRQGSAARVLLVNDSATVRESTSAHLRASGFAVTLASNGFEALARVVQNRPDIVFADASMPELDGYQICALLKSNSNYCHIPVIMMTGREGLVDQERAALVGCDTHISKPFTAQTLNSAACKVSLLHQIDDVMPQAVPVNNHRPG
ncbi:MAG: PleD family two-component system response regulator [Granulosicoccus sp.]